MTLTGPEAFDPLQARGDAAHLAWAAAHACGGDRRVGTAIVEALDQSPHRQLARVSTSGSPPSLPRGEEPLVGTRRQGLKVRSGRRPAPEGVSLLALGISSVL